jgi:myosin-5
VLARLRDQAQRTERPAAPPQILFDKTQTIIGARIRTYLLERSRLVYQPESERNYHIFYQLLAGLPSSDLKSIGLDDASKFFYMNQGGASARSIPGVDDAEELKATEKALDTVGITSSTRWQIFQLLGALLHIGNVEIKQTRSDAFIAEDDAHVKYVTDLLGIDASEYKKWTVKKQITTRSEKIVTALTAPQALVVRDSVAKFIYACLFDWLVSVVNESLAKDAGEVASFIGVLDIYGFEHFSTSPSWRRNGIWAHRPVRVSLS